MRSAQARDEVKIVTSGRRKNKIEREEESAAPSKSLIGAAERRHGRGQRWSASWATRQRQILSVAFEWWREFVITSEKPSRPLVGVIWSFSSVHLMSERGHLSHRHQFNGEESRFYVYTVKFKAVSTGPPDQLETWDNISAARCRILSRRSQPRTAKHDVRFLFLLLFF